MEAVAGQRPSPEPPDEDVAMPFKPCLRRVGRWMAEGAELEDKPMEKMALYECRPPWTPSRGAVRIITDLPVQTRRTDPPDKRRQAAELAIAALPPADVTVWSDGSAAGGTQNGGAGALIEMHSLHRKLEIRAAAGAVCSSLRAELMAIHEALRAIADLPAHEQADSKRIRILTDSRSGLQLLKQGPSGQTSRLTSEVWHLIHRLEDQEHELVFQWIPGHAGVEGNEAADKIAGEAARADQDLVPIDLASARGAIKRHAQEMAHVRARAAHPYVDTPTDQSDLSRWGSVTVAQLRTGRSPLTRDTLLRLTRAENDLCPACGEQDSVEHLLTDCPAYARIRGQLWGFAPTLQEVFADTGKKIVEFLTRVGRTDPPVDAAPQQAP